MRILALTGQALDAVRIYRISGPLTYLSKNTNIRCNWMPMAHAAMRMSQGETAFLENDIVILAKQLVDRDSEDFFSALRHFGARKVVYEVDDDYSGRYRPPDGSKPGDWMPILPHVDAVTVTTSHLADLAKEDSGGKATYVLPNAIDLDWFSKVSREAIPLYPDEITIMVAGTKSHQKDWRVLADVMPGILADYPEVTFLAVCEKEHYEFLDATFLMPAPYQQYPMLLRQADILCAPLLPDDRFNWSKSPIKAIEGWSAERRITKTRQGGCAVIASKAPPYMGVVEHRHNGLLVNHTAEAWDEGLRLLIEDRLLRQKVQYEGFKDARRYDISERWVDWQRAYEHIGGNNDSSG